MYYYLQCQLKCSVWKSIVWENRFNLRGIYHLIDSHWIRFGCSLKEEGRHFRIVPSAKQQCVCMRIQVRDKISIFCGLNKKSLLTNFVSQFSLCFLLQKKTLNRKINYHYYKSRFTTIFNIFAKWGEFFCCLRVFILSFFKDLYIQHSKKRISWL